MQFLNKLYGWYGKRTVIIMMAVIGVLILIGLFSVFDNGDEPEPVEEVKSPMVAIKPVRSLIQGNAFTAVGKVQAVSEADLKTEAGGRVTVVNVEIGDRVQAGMILASLENSSQRAALLQAEGAYEAALANAKRSVEQGGSSVRDAETGLANAKNQAVTAIRNAYNTSNNALLISIDKFFSDPDGMLPGVRIDHVNTSYLNSERIAFQSIMDEWQVEAQNATPSSDLTRLLKEAEERVERLVALLDELIAGTNKAGSNDNLAGAAVSTYTAGLIAERGTLNNLLQSIRTAQSGLVSAEEALSRANIGDTPSDTTLADAQVKIALGSLRSAQSNYEKTIVRTPITGVVNALYLKAGEYVSPSAPAAIVANNNGLEIATGVSIEDSEHLSINDTVTIDDKTVGTIVAIAGAIDPTTGKVAVKISIDDPSQLQNGSTVAIQFRTEAEVQTEDSDIVIPLSAIKMTGSGPVVFSVQEADSTLKSIPVTLGDISGENVIVTDGVTLDSVIVVDARGLKEGEVVTVSSN